MLKALLSNYLYCSSTEQLTLMRIKCKTASSISRRQFAFALLNNYKYWDYQLTTISEHLREALLRAYMKAVIHKSQELQKSWSILLYFYSKTFEWNDSLSRYAHWNPEILFSCSTRWLPIHRGCLYWTSVMLLCIKKLESLWYTNNFCFHFCYSCCAINVSNRRRTYK